MAVAIVHYSHNHFQTLPSLNQARESFLKSGGDELVQGVFKDFFIKHKMEYTFGLAMPHRHFNIPPGQLMVNYNGTATAWNATPGDGMDKPQPAAWSFSPAGELVPIEFSYSKGHKFEFGEKESVFVAEFRRLLDGRDLRDVFGLCEYPGDDFEGTCEITIGSANINLKPKDVRQSTTGAKFSTDQFLIQYPEGLEGVDTAFFFSPPLIKRGCRCVCDNREDPHGHGAHVTTQSG